MTAAQAHAGLHLMAAALLAACPLGTLDRRPAAAARRLGAAPG